MSIFEEATRKKLRIATPKGNLSVEDLWDLSLAELNTVAKRLNKTIKEADEEDFLQESKKDTETELRFDLVIHILNTKKQERDSAKEAKAKKEKKARLLALLDEKENETLRNMSADEIRKQLEELEP